jgi:hypothetical protein
MNHQHPTEDERLALEKLRAGQTLPLVLGGIATPIPVLLRLVPETYSSVSAVLSVGVVLGIVSLFVYRTCMLRCPRCSGWIVIPKCPACGLKLEKSTSRGITPSR